MLQTPAAVADAADDAAADAAADADAAAFLQQQQQQRMSVESFERRGEEKNPP